MYIEQLCSKQGMKEMTLHLNYDEVRDTANALYYLVSGKSPEKDYSELQAKWQFLFDMVKHGMIQPETVGKLQKAREAAAPAPLPFE